MVCGVCGHTAVVAAAAAADASALLVGVGVVEAFAVVALCGLLSHVVLLRISRVSAHSAHTSSTASLDGSGLAMLVAAGLKE